jgi:hypothetical protein
MEGTQTLNEEGNSKLTLGEGYCTKLINLVGDKI